VESQRAHDDFEETEPERLPDFLRDPIGIVRRRWTWLLLALALGLGATGVSIAAREPRYLAEATALVTTQQIPEDFVRTTVPDDAMERLNGMVGEVLSRARLVDIVEKFELYSELRDEVTLAEIVERTRGDIHIELKPGVAARGQRSTARLFGIAFEADHPEVAAAVANELATMLANESFRRRSRQARLTAEFLRTELDRAERELREQSRLVTEFRLRHRGELPTDLAPNLARLERLHDERQGLALQIAEAQSQLVALSQERTMGAALDSPQARLEGLRARLAQELAHHTEDHPNVQLMRRELAALEAQLGDGSPEARRRDALIAAAERSLAQLRAQAEEAQRQLQEIDADVASTPARQEELAALEERENVLREQYLEFLRKVQDADLAESLEAAQQGERLEVLDRAEPPSTPTRAREKYLVAGLVGSLILALLTALVLETLDPVLLSAAQIEATTGRPALGWVARLP
jgi:uncharacterized protein involved in exopolysaccharide biosynthesis